jgi:hypothetical protein
MGRNINASLQRRAKLQTKGHFSIQQAQIFAYVNDIKIIARSQETVREA